MNVVFLTALTSHSAGGLFFTITSLCKELLKQGVDVSVLGFDDFNSASDRHEFGNVKVAAYHVTSLPLLSTLGYSSDIHQILENLHPDIIHLQGIWMYHSYAALKYRKKHPETRLIIEPHGMLDPWAVKNSFWKKKIVGHLFEYENLHKADCIHALCRSELESVRKFGLQNPVAIIPNGITIPTSFIRQDKKPGKKTLLYIGRIHPKKGLAQLIEAFALLKKESPFLLNQWELRIAGWDQNNHRDELEIMVDKFGLRSIISFIGPVIGKQKENELINADAFILPSFSEGLPMSILEAWSYSLPVIMTEFCNLPEGFDYNAAIEISPNADSIRNSLCHLFSMTDNQLHSMGHNGLGLVQNHFTWNVIAQNTVKLYNHLLNSNTAKPNFIYNS